MYTSSLRSVSLSFSFLCIIPHCRCVVRARASFSLSLFHRRARAPTLSRPAGRENGRYFSYSGGHRDASRAPYSSPPAHVRLPRPVRERGESESPRRFSLFFLGSEKLIPTDSRESAAESITTHAYTVSLGAEALVYFFKTGIIELASAAPQ